LSVGGGYDIDATINIGGSTYLGPVSEVTNDMIPGVSYWGSAAIAAGGNIGLTGFYQPTSTGLGVVGGTINIGGGIPFGPLPFNASGGVSTTNVIH